MNGLRARHVAPHLLHSTESVPSCQFIHHVLRFSLCCALALSLSLTGCSPRSQAVLPRFRDVTKEAGIRFKHTSGAAGKKYFVETMGAGGAFLDYDNDGWLDVLLLNGRSLNGKGSGFRVQGSDTQSSTLNPQPLTLKLYRNNRDGTFTDATHKAGLDVTMYAMGCAVGDYDNDGWMDVYISAVLDSGRLFRNNKGHFEDVTEQAGVGNAGNWGTSCAWLDYDRDGDLDLYVANYVLYRSLADDIPCLIRGTRRSYCVPSAYKGSSGVLYRNNGDGTFADVTRAVGVYEPQQKALGVAVCDYDDDGWLDLAVANDTAQNRLFHNVRGKFVEVAELAGMAFGAAGQARAGMGIDAADWRNDGTLAIAITNFPHEAIGFYTQKTPRADALTDESNAVGIAAPSLPRLGFGILFGDWDNDGYRDLLAVNGHVQDDIAAKPPRRLHRRGYKSSRSFTTPRKPRASISCITTVRRASPRFSNNPFPAARSPIMTMMVGWTFIWSTGATSTGAASGRATRCIATTATGRSRT